MHLRRTSRRRQWWRTANELDEPPQVLRGCGEQHLVSRAAQASQSKPVQPENALKPVPIPQGDCLGIITWGCDRNCSPIFDPYPKSRRQERRGKNVTVGKSLFGTLFCALSNTSVAENSQSGQQSK